MNKNVSKDVCKNIVGAYKRASNIIDQELKSKKEEAFWASRSLFYLKKMKRNIYMTK